MYINFYFRTTAVSSLRDVPGTKSRVQLDIDRLTNSIEHSIADDKVKMQMAIYRNELLKSNPGLFSNVKDITNPRELYLVNTNPKSRSNGESQSANGILTSLPRVTRTLSMHAGNGLSKTKHHASIVDLPAKEHFEPGIKPITPQSTSWNNLRTMRDSDDKENLKSLDLPSLNKSEDPAKKPRVHVVIPSFPKLRRQVDDIDSITEESVSETNTYTHEPSNNKLNKWFSDRPIEILEKTQRVLMEQTTREGIQHEWKQKANRFKAKTPSVRLMGNIPQKFLELRTDKRGRTRKQKELDRMEKIDRDYYKLRQKSLLKLKLATFKQNHRSGQNEIGGESQMLKPVLRKSNTTTSKQIMTQTHTQTQAQTQAQARAKRSSSLKTSVRGSSTDNIKTQFNDQFMRVRVDNGELKLNNSSEFDDISNTNVVAKEIFPAKAGVNREIHGKPCEVYRENTKASVVNIGVEPASDLATPEVPAGSHPDQIINGVIGATADHMGSKTENCKELKIGHNASMEFKSPFGKFKVLHVFSENENKNPISEEELAFDMNQTYSQRKPNPLYKLDVRRSRSDLQRDVSNRFQIRNKCKSVIDYSAVSFEFRAGEVVVTRTNVDSTVLKRIPSEQHMHEFHAGQNDLLHQTVFGDNLKFKEHENTRTTAALGRTIQNDNVRIGLDEHQMQTSKGQITEFLQRVGDATANQPMDSHPRPKQTELERQIDDGHSNNNTANTIVKTNEMQHSMGILQHSHSHIH